MKRETSNEIRVNPRGSIVIPKAVVDAAGLKVGDRFEVEADEVEAKLLLIMK